MTCICGHERNDHTHVGDVLLCLNTGCNCTQYDPFKHYRTTRNNYYYWTSPNWPTCDYCLSLGRATAAIVDAKTLKGKWSYMCARHADDQMIRLGLGRGQKLVDRRGHSEGSERLGG